MVRLLCEDSHHPSSLSAYLWIHILAKACLIHSDRSLSAFMSLLDMHQAEEKGTCPVPMFPAELEQATALPFCPSCRAVNSSFLYLVGTTAF